MATSTLAKSPNSHQLLAVTAGPFARRYRKARSTFRVFPTGAAGYPWRIAELVAEQTVSCHKSLSFALKKCARLNQSRAKGATDETN